mgnify:CR=1 FL=1
MTFPGTQTTLYAVLNALLGEGDEVLLGDPLYATYEGLVASTGAALVRVPLRPEHGFRMQVADVAARLLNRGTGENGAGDGAERNGRKFRIPAADEVPVPVVPRLQDAAEKGLKTGNGLMNELMNW